MLKLKKMNKVLLGLLTALLLILSPSMKYNTYNKEVSERDYYLEGDFRTDGETESYRMKKPLEGNENKRYYKVTNMNDKEGGVDFSIDIKEVDSKEIVKKDIARGTLPGVGTYYIRLNYNQNSGKYSVEIEDVSSDVSKNDKYYVRGDFNNYHIGKASEMTKQSEDIYLLDIHTNKDNQKFFIEYNNKRIKDTETSKTEFEIEDKGYYRIKLDFSSGTAGEEGKITIRDISEQSDLESYYVVGDFNNYKKDVTSLMIKDEDSSPITYTYTLTTTEKNTQFVIANGTDSYKTEGLNKGTNFLIKDKGTYTITFTESPFKVKWEEKESDKYYLLGIDSTEKDRYSEMDYVSKGKYEKEVHVDRETLFYFSDENDNEFHDQNNKDYVIASAGDYHITFIVKNGSHNVIIENMDEEEQYHKYYLLGNFNKYVISEDYALEHNEDNKEFIEFRIELDLKKGDEFYISDGKKIYKKPNNDNVVVDEDGRYEILFSKDYDYGNNYHITWDLLDEKDAEIEIIEIGTVDELLQLIEDSKVDNYSLNKSFEITNDLDLEGLVIEPIQILRGTINGNYHTISNFTIDRGTNGNEFGFIRKTTDEASIRNLTLDYDIETKEKKTILGSIVGINYGKIYNCKYNGEIKGVNIVGGIAGSNEESGEIVRCTNNGNISAKTIVGGICGINKGLVKDSNNNAVINQLRFTAADENKVSNIGGIVGLNEGTINKCKNTNTIGTKQVGNFIGGIAGSNLGEVKNSINDGNVNGNKFVGGIVGYYAEFVDNTTDKYYNTTIKLLKEVLKEYDKNVPELDEEEDEDIKIEDKEDIKTGFRYNINNGNIYGEQSIGGVVGYLSNEDDSSATDKKKDHNFMVELSINEGNVYANNNYAGGIVGRHNIGVISSCYNTGEVEAKTNYAGGIVGSSTGKVEYCYNISLVEGESYVGGIGGSNKEIHDCYSISSLTSNDGSFVGAISGFIDKIDKNTYNNYFVFSDYNGIDNTNYHTKAEVVDRTKLASKEALTVNLDKRYYSVDDKHNSYPYLRMMVDDKHDNLLVKEFKEKLAKTNAFTCIITFLDEDDETVSRVFVPYGEDLDKKDLPIPPSKEDNFASWDNFDLTNITSDKKIKVFYEEIVTSIASDETSKPQLIVEGEFYDTTLINLDETHNNYLLKDAEYKSLGSYKVEVVEYEHDLDVSNILVKFRLPKLEDVSVAFIDNGNIKFIDFYIDGEYACFNIDKAQEFIILEKEYYSLSNPKFIANLAVSIVVASAGVAAIITTAVIVNKKIKTRPKKDKKTKKNKKNQE